MRWLLVAVLLGVGSAACSDDAGSSSGEISDEGFEAESPSELSTMLRDEGLTTIASAIDVIDVEQLFGGAPFTLLAPSDEAFQAMEADELGELLAEPESLLAVLQNHVIDERIEAADMAGRSSVRTTAGNDLDVESNETGDEADDTEAGAPGLMIGGGSVTATDIAVGDGVVHVVDRIYLP